MGSVRLAADAVVACDSAGTVLRPGAVHVADGRVTYVGAPLGGEEHVHGLLMPGLVNVHCHTPMTLFRGAAEDVPLDLFLRAILWPREARLEPDDVYWGMALGAAEALTRGVTTTCEMYVHEEAIVRAVLDARLRCVLTPGVMDVPGWMSWSDRLEDVLAFHDRIAGVAEAVTVGIAAHSAYALPLDALREIARAAREREALVHIHLAETAEEGRTLEEEHGRSVTTLLAEIGLLDARVLAAHCVHLSDDDLRVLAEHDVAVAHCPQSNAKLAAGVARLSDLLAAGLRVGLGTDGPASNNDLDLWEELRLAPLLARLRTGDAGALPAAEALRLATRGGADALGVEAGAIEPGRWGDLVLVRLDDPAFTPLLADHDLLSHLVWSAGSRLVAAVWVAGDLVVSAGECTTVDVERARREVQDRAARLAVA